VTAPLHFAAADGRDFVPVPTGKGIDVARLGAWFVMILVPFCALLDWMA
jgi:hypothetical protein